MTKNQIEIDLSTLCHRLKVAGQIFESSDEAGFSRVRTDKLAELVDKTQALADFFDKTSANVLLEMAEMRKKLLDLNRTERLDAIHSIDECIDQMLEPSLDMQAGQLMMSATMQHLAEIAGNMPLDVANNPDDLKTALSTALVGYCRAMDAGEISFHTVSAGGAMLGLATTAFVMTVGKPERERATFN